MLKDPFLPLVKSPAQIPPAPDPPSQLLVGISTHMSCYYHKLSMKMSSFSSKLPFLSVFLLYIKSIIIFQLPKVETLGSPSAPPFHTLFLSDYQGLPILIWKCHSSLSRLPTTFLWAFIRSHFNAWHSSPSLSSCLTLPSLNPSHLPVPTNNIIKVCFLTNVIIIPHLC